MSFNYRYRPVPVAASTTVNLKNGHIGGFLCATSGETGGTIKLVDGDGTTLLDDMAVTAGTWYPLPFAITPGGTFTTGSGATGLLAI